MLWGWALSFHPEAAALTDEMWGFASALGLEGTANLLNSKRKKIIPFEYPGLTLEFKARSQECRNCKLPVTALDVALGEHGIELVVRATGQRQHLHNGELSSLVHSLFALPRCVPFPLDLGAMTPRIVWDDIVVQRARWRLKREEDVLAASYPGTSFSLFHDMRRLKQRLDLPERVFVNLPSQPKPFFVDFRCHFLLEAWEALFGAEEEATVSEMLPNPDELWLTDHQGNKVTAELRTSFGRASLMKTTGTSISLHAAR
jgi:hypothetical protein